MIDKINNLLKRVEEFRPQAAAESKSSVYGCSDAKAK